MRIREILIIEIEKKGAYRHLLWLFAGLLEWSQRWEEEQEKWVDL